MVFLDSDVVFIKDIFKFFSLGGKRGPFDVGLTYRMMPKFPINTGEQAAALPLSLSLPLPLSLSASPFLGRLTLPHSAAVPPRPRAHVLPQRGPAAGIRLHGGRRGPVQVREAPPLSVPGGAS